MVGKRLSHFEIVEELGAGGMGRVYRAWDVDLQRPVAIKVLPEGALADEDRRERFVREARAASALNHPGIVTIFEIGSAGNLDFIAMELVDGERLDAVAGTEGMAVAKVVDLGSQIADALAAAHRAMIVHRDLKPANVVVTEAGRAKILDFGLAKRRPDSRSDSRMPTMTVPETMTATGAVIGTPHYMSPEQARGGAVDERTDVFAFGCLLYRLLAGRPPFEGTSPAEVMSAILRDEPTPIEGLRSDVPEILGGLVRRCLAKDPAHRPRDGGELAEELAASDWTGGGSGEREEEPSPSEPPAKDRGRRRGAWWVAGSLAALVVMASSLWMAGRPETVESSGGLRATSFRPLPLSGGDHRQAAISPDGRLVAFVTEDTGGIPQVWVMDLVGAEPVQVTRSGAAASRPRWSPGGEIVYALEDHGIWSVSPLGGSPRRIVDRGHSPDVADDGRLVFVRDREIWTLDGEGASPRRVPGARPSYFWAVAEYLRLEPAVSPDGLWVCYYQPERDWPVGDLWIVPIDGGKDPRRLTYGSFVGGEPDWTPDGSTIVFSADLAGSRTLWSIPAAGGEPRPVTTGAGVDSEPFIGTLAERLVYTNARNTHALVRKDIETGEETVLLERRVAIAQPEVSRSGDRIAFFGLTEKGAQLFTVAPDGSGLLQVTRGVGGNIVPHWSTDGKHLFYYRRRGDPALVRVPAEGGESVDVLPGWVWVEKNGAVFDPSEGRVAYTVWRDGGPVEARILDRESGEELELEAVVTSPIWSPDGDAIYGTTPGGDLERCSPVDGSCSIVGEGYRARWGPDGRVYSIRLSDDPEARDTVELWSVTPDGEDPRRHVELRGFLQLLFGYDILPDGDVVWNRFEPGREELWMADLVEK